MISVPREEIELKAHCLRMEDEKTAADELEAFLDQPAAQHYGEPVAWQIVIEGYKTITVDNYQRAMPE